MSLEHIDSVLIANRGEIAVRVIRTARELGLRTIAVYSELDRDALHVELADEAWAIGPAPAAESYLNIDRILEVAKASRAAAIHPGYGFLAENPEFARRVIASDVIWVGPPAESIDAMGDKMVARETAASGGVPIVPGVTESITDPKVIRDFAAENQYPVAVKAAHGGGGKGLRVVWDDEEVDEAFEGARREAEAYFGNPTVYVEKYLDKPRHIEAQILFDSHGKGLFLGERDCTVQRRHQKLIEESPAPAFTDEQRATLAEAAVAAGHSCGYVNAGTVEFIMDQSGGFYFLEMNTRLQVEHTVTEMVTGLDLVRYQFIVADGQPLDLDAVTFSGHAIELRINAEDPYRDFVPTPGQVVEWRVPSGPGVRMDSWITPSTRVSQYYDNLMGKLIVWGSDREHAIARGKRALNEMVVTGVHSTIPAHLAVLDTPEFANAEHYTRWLEEEVTLPAPLPDAPPQLAEDEELVRRDLTVEVGGRRFGVAFWAPEAKAPSSGRTRRRPPKLEKRGGSAASDGVIVAPMQGTIVKVSVKAGDTVSEGQAICVLEAMKMENEVRAPSAGEITDLRIQAGDTVSPNQVIAVVR
ncbi:MAG: acetyl-CoA carboxylase biotin carboxylase subunit [Acidimicrobiia bacterium]|nr:acetyl-CoA carboxylase biotin carboxylase subunit [Acidimicrobiia bacterium]